ncbi:MAG: 4'-phosphopantetheinyl transferase superfamily protein [Peptococcaceae bacterium]|jgi:phosphopantetheinyl transferase|nr:4'-phosphopantetheinyl transferase superfamily protein [Peptococcaceae bacterium]
MNHDSPITYVDDLLLKTETTDHKAAVYFCYFPVSSYYMGLAGCLHREERQYFDTLGSQKRKKSYLMGRYSAKTATCRLTNENNFQNISISQGIFGQPVIACLFNHNIQVSITHSNDIAAAIAFPEAVPMGIDVELPDPETTGVLESRTTDREKYLLRSIPLAYLDMLTLLWTVKESLSKALRVGLMASYSIFEVGQIEEQPNGVLCRFKNLPQFKTITFKLGAYLCTVAYPEQTDLRFDVEALQAVFQEV